MMRLPGVLLTLLLVATAAAARPFPAPKPLQPARPLLNLGSFSLFREAMTAEPVASPTRGGADEKWSQGSDLPNLSLGPLRAHFGSDDNPRADLSIYRMQGMDQLGSAVLANQRGRSAKILFVWPTDK